MIHQYLGPMDFQRNNLISASNPYLRQHKDNPVWWQEWSPQTLEYAREHDKPLLVSVGYSTCHWCHVMAQEAFSDILRQVREFYDERKGDIEPFEVAAGESPAARTGPCHHRLVR